MHDGGRARQSSRHSQGAKSVRMRISGFRASVGIALTWVIFAPGRAVAQVTVETVTGKVTLVDSSGDLVDPPDIGVISGLVVYLADPDGGQAWRSETNDEGRFHFERVPDLGRRASALERPRGRRAGCRRSCAERLHPLATTRQGSCSRRE